VLPGALGLWAEDRWTWHGRIVAGQRLTARATLWSLDEKQSRTGELMVAQTEHYEVAGEAGARLAELYRTVMRLEPREQRPASSSSPALHHYSGEDLAAIERQYAAEASQRRGPQPRFWEDVAIGDSLGRLVKGPLTVGGIAAFMAGLGPPMLPANRIAHSYIRRSPQVGLRHANGAADPMGAIHLDGELASRAGFDRGYDLGSQRISWLAHAVSDWMPGNCSSCRSASCAPIWWATSPGSPAGSAARTGTPGGPASNACSPRPTSATRKPRAAPRPSCCHAGAYRRAPADGAQVRRARG
jgi:hypothetical protein